MLYPAKPLLEQKYNALKAPETDGFLADFGSSIVKNIGVSLHKLIKQKYGRKFVQKQGRELNFTSPNTPFPFMSANKSEAEEKRLESGKPNLTPSEQMRRKNIKRHTYNNQCYPSEQDDSIENDLGKSRDDSMKNKRTSIAAQATNMQEAAKRSYIEKRAFQNKQQVVELEMDLDDNECEILKPKTHTRKFSIHSKLTPIDFNQSISQKPSLVDLIKKFKFENLKTAKATPTHSKSSMDDAKTHDTNLTKTQSRKQCSFFKQQNRTFHNQSLSRKVTKKPSKQFIKETREVREHIINKNVLKKMNSLLSPWGTISDQYFISQSPLE